MKKAEKMVRILTTSLVRWEARPNWSWRRLLASSRSSSAQAWVPWVSSMRLWQTGFIRSPCGVKRWNTCRVLESIRLYRLNWRL